MARPWQVRTAVGLCFLSLLLELPGVVDELWFRIPDDIRATSFFGVMIGVISLVIVLICVLIVLLAHGYRWARVVYAIVALLGLAQVFSSVPESFGRATYLGILSVVAYTLDVAALCLLFTRPANAWFRTRGGRIAPP